MIGRHRGRVMLCGIAVLGVFACSGPTTVGRRADGIRGAAVARTGDHPSTRYPESRFLTATSCAGDAATACGLASLGVCSLFGSLIEGEVRVLSETVTRRSGADGWQTVLHDFQRVPECPGRESIVCDTVRDVWRERGESCAVAHLDRAAADRVPAALWKRQLVVADEQFSAGRRAFESRDYPGFVAAFNGFSDAFGQTMEALKERSVLLGRAPPEWPRLVDSSATMLSWALIMKKEARVGLASPGRDGDIDNRGVSWVQGALKDLGISLEPRGRQACGPGLTHGLSVAAEETCRTRGRGESCSVRIEVSGGPCAGGGLPLLAVVGPVEAVVLRDREAARRKAWQALDARNDEAQRIRGIVNSWLPAR